MTNVLPWEEFLQRGDAFEIFAQNHKGERLYVSEDKIGDKDFTRMDALKYIDDLIDKDLWHSSKNSLMHVSLTFFNLAELVLGNEVEPTVDPRKKSRTLHWTNLEDNSKWSTEEPLAHVHFRLSIYKSRNELLAKVVNQFIQLKCKNYKTALAYSLLGCFFLL
jgi:hypothetical protein